MSRILALINDRIFCPDGNCQYPPHGPYCEEGPIITGAHKTFSKGRAAARQGDMGVCCGPTFMTEGSHKVFIEGLPAHRVGDGNACNGFTKGPGAVNVFIGD